MNFLPLFCASSSWFPKNCITKLFSRGEIAKSRLVATREEVVKVFRHFVQRIISAAAALWTFIESLQHRTTKEEV